MWIFLACTEVGLSRTGAEVRGVAVLDDGTPVAGATVTVGGASTSTDADGVFAVDGVAAGERRVDLEAAGVSAAGVTVPVPEAGTVDVVLRALSLVRVTLGDAAAGGEVRTGSGLRLTFPPNALVDSAGAPVTGAVDVDVAHIDEARLLLSGPGPLADATGTPLVSNGMVEVRLSQAEAEVALAVPVSLSFPLLSEDDACAPAFGLYGFDSGLGAWVAEPGGVVTAGRFEATVEHFSYWNCDRPAYGDGCIQMELQREGEPFADRQVGVWVANGTAMTTWTDASGGIVVPAPSGQTTMVTAIYDSEGSTRLEDVEAVWASVPVDVPESGCADLGTIEVTGADQDGDEQPVVPWGHDCDDLDPDRTARCAWMTLVDTGTPWTGGSDSACQ